MMISKKKRSSLILRPFFCPTYGDLQKKKLRCSLNKKKVFVWVGALNILRGKIAQNFDAKMPKEYEIAQNFDAKLPKIYEIAQNFAQISDTLDQPGGPVPPTFYANGDTPT